MSSTLATPGSSDRMFGCVMSGFFLLVSGLPLLSGGVARRWAFIVSAAFLVFALVLPRFLAPLNKAWSRFGLVMSSVMSPIALGVLFFLAITPYGWLMRRLGKGAIPVGFCKESETYWIKRDPPGPDPESLKDQF